MSETPEQKLKRLDKEQKERLLKNDPSYAAAQKVKLDITVDNPSADKLAQLIEEERNEKKLDDAEGKELHAISQTIRDKIILQYSEKGHLAPSLETEVDVENAIAILKDLPDRPKPSGSAPLNAQQMGQSDPNLYRKGFPDIQSMIRFLKQNEKNDPAAKAFYDEMWRKLGIPAMKSHEQIAYEQPKGDASNDSGQDVIVRDWGQLKGGKSEIREALDRANEAAREKIMHEYNRRMKKKESEKE